MNEHNAVGVDGGRDAWKGTQNLRYSSIAHGTVRMLGETTLVRITRSSDRLLHSMEQGVLPLSR
jgi:hypothetical protein